MVKHKWENYTPEDISKAISGYAHRKCVLCGATQTKESKTSWMRVVGYYWFPLVGKCKGKSNG